MLTRFRSFLTVAAVTLLSVVATAGAGIQCWAFLYQPQPPEELR